MRESCFVSSAISFKHHASCITFHAEFPMSIVLENISKRFGGQWVVDNVSLEVADKELFVLLGSSGSGKSTILRMIAGLSRPTSGQILLHGTDVTNLPPQNRGT